MLINAVAGMIKISGVNPNGLSNQDPLWKFVLGTNYKSGGSYDGDDWYLIEQRQKEFGWDREKAELSIIKERIAVPVQLIDLCSRKLNTFWWSLDGLGWTIDFIKLPILSYAIVAMQVSEFFAIFLFSVLGLFQVKKVAKKETKILLIPFIIFVNFLIYMTIEVQGRYAYLNQISVFLLSGGGMIFVREKIYEGKNN